MTLQFEVVNQRLCIHGTYYVVSGSENYIDAEFIFSDDWDGLTKKAIFRRMGKSEVKEADINSNGKCSVPADVIKSPGMCVYVIGVAGEKTVYTDREIIDIIPNGGEKCDDITDGISTGMGWEDVTVDNALSPLSTNPVQNCVVYYAIQGRAEINHKHTADDIGAVDENDYITNTEILEIIGGI